MADAQHAVVAAADSTHFARSRALFERAQAVVPSGIYGHQSPALLTRDAFPSFLAEGEGCRIRDVDGNEYIDFMCAYGPIVLGYRHPGVEEAVERQRRHCDTMNLPSAAFVELAERLVGLTPGAEWTVFAKNGSDVCTWALAVAREATGRSLVAMADHTYHGIHGWCNPFTQGFPENERSGIRVFAWNDLAAVERLFVDNGDDLAAVILTPFRHEAFEDSVMAAPGFLEAVRTLCDTHGAVMILDDVRAGFRLHLGGSAQCWGVTPDIQVYSKALANGYPLSAMLGAERLRKAARAVFMTGTFYTQAVPIAAALATIDDLERNDGIGQMERMGTRLCEGLAERAAAEGFDVTISGPPAIPFMSFTEDAGSFERARLFAGACAQRGIFLHPVHNWFMSTAHREVDIDLALHAAAEAFAELRTAF